MQEAMKMIEQTDEQRAIFLAFQNAMARMIAQGLKELVLKDYDAVKFVDDVLKKGEGKLTIRVDPVPFTFTCELTRAGAYPLTVFTVKEPVHAN